MGMGKKPRLPSLELTEGDLATCGKRSHRPASRSAESP